MEFPIKIIVTIVIAMIVSISFLEISRNILSSSETKMDSLSRNDVELINIDAALSAIEIAYIAEECNKIGEDNTNIELCFIIMTSGATCTSDVETQWNSLGHTEPLTITGTGNTLYFYYNNPGINIECN
jgi:hypothetical protein